MRVINFNENSFRNQFCEVLSYLLRHYQNLTLLLFRQRVPAGRDGRGCSIA